MAASSSSRLGGGGIFDSKLELESLVADSKDILAVSIVIDSKLNLVAMVNVPIICDSSQLSVFIPVQDTN